MGAQQPGWERSSEDGSAAARMGAQQPGWERSSQDGSEDDRISIFIGKTRRVTGR
ncbi:hypothetical protein HBH98_256310 [Parastagonospora nodorum]|nr:hypothetical protein HBH98_256310 [Parastagonospora nodorum]KAH4354178.1 hypothetical protein HBH97_254940 [Parastagonospora nodorum]